MMGLWLMLAVALGGDCPVSFDARVSLLLGEGLRDHYLCVVEADDSERQLVSYMGPTWKESAAPLRRALVFVLLNTTNRLWNPKHVLLLSPADRRLLADGVKARKGRKSPSVEHHAIFNQWQWYRPIPSYTDNRMSQTDRINVGMADNPEEFIPKSIEAKPTSSGCGCVSSTPMSLGWMSIVWILIGIRRRNGV